MEDKYHVSFSPQSTGNGASESSELTSFHDKAKLGPIYLLFFRLNQDVCHYWSDTSVHFKRNVCGPGNQKKPLDSEREKQ